MLVEGAGSAAEVNLRQSDIANMGFACAAGVPVALIGDIDRGGVIAQLVGTWSLLDEAERALVKGFVVNKFRGDLSLFDDGIALVRERTGMASFGIVPWFADAAALPAEDAFGLAAVPEDETGGVRIAVPVCPRISNFDDLDPLHAEPRVEVVMVTADRRFPETPTSFCCPAPRRPSPTSRFCAARDGTSTSPHMRGEAASCSGSAAAIRCSGGAFPIPMAWRGIRRKRWGWGLLDVTTVLTRDKALRQVSGAAVPTGQAVKGYEMHVGETTGPDAARPMLALAGGPDGAISADRRTMGCHVHGLFASDGFRSAFLEGLRPGARSLLNYEAGVEDALDALARHLEAHLDLDAMLQASAMIASNDAASAPAARR